MARSNPLAPRRHALSRVPRVVWYGLMALGVGVFAWHMVSKDVEIRRGRVADAKAWAIDGPACPRITRAEFLGRGQKGPRGFTYEDVTFLRRFGHVACAPIYEKSGLSRRFHPACQFTSPGDLMVRTEKGEWYFRAGPGQPATIFTTQGEARCVLASNYTVANFNAAPIQ